LQIYIFFNIWLINAGGDCPLIFSFKTTRVKLHLELSDWFIAFSNNSQDDGI